MLTITSIVGNIFHDKKLVDRLNRMESLGKCERFKISRQETERTKLRRKTDKGSDIGLVLYDDVRIKHGDVLLSNSKKFIVVEQLAEKVISIRIKKKTNFELLVMIGHIIGNRHKPISIEGNVISFPIQADSEIEVFRKLLPSVINDVNLIVTERIFQPLQGINIHEH